MTGIYICLIAWFTEPWLVEVCYAGDFSFRANTIGGSSIFCVKDVTTVSSFHQLEGISESDLSSNGWMIGDSSYLIICGSQRFYILSCLYSRVQRNAHSKGLFTTLVWCFESDLFLAGLKWSLRWQLGDIWYHDTVTEIISILSFIISWIVVSCPRETAEKIKLVRGASDDCL